MPDSDKGVKCCASCGYLGLRHTLTGQIVTAGRDFRDRAYIPALQSGGHDLAYEPFPICFRGVVGFRAADEAGNSRNEEQCKKAIQRERKCDEFSKWEGLDPAEHYAMVQETARLQWQAEREDVDKKDRADREREQRTFQADQAARAEKFQAEQAVQADTRHRESLKLAEDLHDRRQRVDWLRLIAAAVLGATLASLVPRFLGSSPAPINVELKLPEPDAGN